MTARFPLLRTGALVLITTFLVGGCSTSHTIRGEAVVALQPSAARSISVAAPVRLTLDGSGKTLEVMGDTRFDAVGRISEGTVFRANERVLLLKGSTNHEVYLVVEGASAVALYVPGRGTVAKLRHPVTLTLAP